MHQPDWAGIASGELSPLFEHTQKRWDTQSQLDMDIKNPCLKHNAALLCNMHA